MKLNSKQNVYRTNIKIDIDNKNLSDYTIEGLYHISKIYNIKKLIIKRSPSGNLHMKINLNNKLTDYEQICVQFILGSDKVRERLNFIRVKNGAKLEDWNILFDKHINIPLKKCYKKIIINEHTYICSDNSPFKCEKHGISILKDIYKKNNKKSDKL